MPFHAEERECGLQQRCSVEVCTAESSLKLLQHLIEYREDALRHYKPYQCERCGRRFGKLFTKERHQQKNNPCVPVAIRENENSEPALWISLEFQRAVSELEKVKGHGPVIAAIEKCNQILGKCPPCVTQ